MREDLKIPAAYVSHQENKPMWVADAVPPAVLRDDSPWLADKGYTSAAWRRFANAVVDG